MLKNEQYLEFREISLETAKKFMQDSKVFELLSAKIREKYGAPNETPASLLTTVWGFVMQDKDFNLAKPGEYIALKSSEEAIHAFVEALYQYWYLIHSQTI